MISKVWDLKGLKILRQVADEEGMAVISEILHPNDMETALEYVDVIQIGARNMHNFELLKVAGAISKPSIIKAWIICNN